MEDFELWRTLIVAKLATALSSACVIVLIFDPSTGTSPLFWFGCFGSLLSAILTWHEFSLMIFEGGPE